MHKPILIWLRLLAIAITFMYLTPLSGQDILFQGWFWDYPKTNEGANWAQHLQDRAQELSDAGFTYVWLPPLSRASFGAGSNGYDPKDLFDLGEFGQGPTGFGTRTDVDNLIYALDQVGINSVADVVYNHRDGGAPEENPAVAGWIRNMTYSKIEVGDQPYPSDRFRMVLPLGGSSGLGAGTYFFKFGSKSGHPNFHNKPYKVYMETNTKGFQGQPNLTEAEPNGGGGCGEPNNVIELGRDMFANIDAFGCTIDEFALTINPGDFDPNGDLLYIYVNNRNVGGLGDYSDHTVLELYYTGGGGNIENRITYQTYTDFANLPSGQGAMNWTNFKPNGNPTQLSGDQDGMFFFYDYDQNVASTRDVLFDWTRWLWNDVDIRGYRMDAVKQFDPAFVGDLLDNLHDNSIDPGLVVGEFFDGNTGALKSWIDQVYANMDQDTREAITPRLFDFSLRFALEASSDAFGYDARNVFNASMVDAQNMSGFNVVTFTDNHDFRGQGERIDNDPILGYAYILTNNQVGLPCVFYDDYYGRGLKPQIDQLIGIQQDYIFGAPQRDYLSRFGTHYTQNFDPASGYGGYPNTTLLYQLSGGISGRDVIVAINYAGETLDVTHGVNINSLGLAPGYTLEEITGNGNSTIINGDGTARFVVPPRSYAVYIANTAPSANAGIDVTYECSSDEGTTISLDGSASTDPENDELTYTWTGSFGSVSGAMPVIDLAVGVHPITLTVEDAFGEIDADEVIITVEDNTAPVFDVVNGPAEPQEVGSSVNITASFSDDCGTPHTANIDWGDGTTAPGLVEEGQISGSHTYTQAGVYVVDISLTDNNGNEQSTEFRYVVIYDPSAGFVTGGGWINSPAGAYSADPSLSGKANFGFVSKYKKGQSQPDGNTNFEFKVANFDFESTLYDWLVIAGVQAKFKGEGTINGQGQYGFMLTARDGDLSGNNSSDQFRIKIWDIQNNNVVVYDNQPGDDDNADASDDIEGGNIKIHSDKKLQSLQPSSDLKDQVAAFSVFPNPSQGPTQINFSLSQENRVRLEVWNASGQLVHRLVDRRLPSGIHSFEWKGLSDQGIEQPSGAYLIRLMTDQEVFTEPIIIAR